MNPTPATSRRFTPELFATIALVLAYIVWVLSLPAWPSQDGPVHLYYAHILSALLSGRPTPYAHFYFIKHLLPPYAFYYYALVALSKFVSLLLADRIILCVYLVLFVFGFRYLARAVGPGADRSTLLVVLLALNCSVGIGFLNYCLSLALVLWAIGLWLRFQPGRFAARLVFLLLVAIVTLTHPVPLLVLLCFCALDLTRRWVVTKRAGASVRVIQPDLVIFLVSLLALFYVRHFATAHPLADTQPVARSFFFRTKDHIVDIVALHHLALIFGRSLLFRLYRFGELATLVIAFALSFVQRLRNRASGCWTAGDSWLVLSAALLVIIPLLPSNISDAFYFFERLSILIWIAPLIAFSGWSPRAGARLSSTHTTFPSLASAALLLFAILTNLALLSEANAILRPIASEITAAAHSAAVPEGQLVLILEDPTPPPSSRSIPSWNPFYWSAAHILRHDNAILDNAPWLDSAIIPLGATPTLPVGSHVTGDSASPHKLSMQLLSSPLSHSKLLSSTDEAIITQPGPPDSSSAERLLNSPDAPESWSCHLAALRYQVCLPTASAAH